MYTCNVQRACFLYVEMDAAITDVCSVHSDLLPECNLVMTDEQATHDVVNTQQH